MRTAPSPWDSFVCGGLAPECVALPKERGLCQHLSPLDALGRVQLAHQCVVALKLISEYLLYVQTMLCSDQHLDL